MTTEKFIYPTGAQVESFLLWLNEGPHAIKAVRRQGRPGYTRPDHIRDIRHLPGRLGMDPEFTAMAKAVKPSNPHELPRELRDELLRNLRVHGYVTPTSGSRQEPRHHSATPLSGRYLHMLRLISHGATAQAAGDVLGITAASVHCSLARARKDHGCATAIELVACVYRYDWFPGYAEYYRLLHQSKRLLGPGYGVRSKRQEA